MSTAIFLLAVTACGDQDESATPAAQKESAAARGGRPAGTFGQEDSINYGNSYTMDGFGTDADILLPGTNSMMDDTEALLNSTPGGGNQKVDILPGNPTDEALGL